MKRLLVAHHDFVSSVVSIRAISSSHSRLLRTTAFPCTPLALSTGSETLCPWLDQKGRGYTGVLCNQAGASSSGLWRRAQPSSMRSPWLLFSFHWFLCLPAIILGARLPKVPIRYCGTENPSSTLRFAHSYLSWAEPLDNDLYNASMVQSRVDSNVHAKTKRQALKPLYTIDTYMHIIADSASALPASPAYVTDSQVRAQFEYLANSFTKASIGFRLLGYRRWTNDTWARNGDDLGMKSALRRGGYSALNIYYQSQLQAAPGTPGIPAGSILLGFCSLPSAGIRPRTEPSVYALDGCNILSSTMPGGSSRGYNRGGSTSHEVGHWSGLLHTFHGNSCSDTNFGDYVADTPQQATSTNGCPAMKDSCPNSGLAPGFDGSGGEFLVLFR